MRGRLYGGWGVPMVFFFFLLLFSEVGYILYFFTSVPVQRCRKV